MTLGCPFPRERRGHAQRDGGAVRPRHRALQPAIGAAEPAQPPARTSTRRRLGRVERHHLSVHRDHAREAAAAGQRHAAAPVAQFGAALGRGLLDHRAFQRRGRARQFGGERSVADLDRPDRAFPQIDPAAAVGPIDREQRHPRAVEAAGEQIGLGDRIARQGAARIHRRRLQPVGADDRGRRHARRRAMDQPVHHEIAVVARQPDRHAVIRARKKPSNTAMSASDRMPGPTS